MLKPVSHAPGKKPTFDAAAQWARLTLQRISPTWQLSSSQPTTARNLSWKNLSWKKTRALCARHQPPASRLAHCNMCTRQALCPAAPWPCLTLRRPRTQRRLAFLPQRGPSSKMARRQPSGHLGLDARYGRNRWPSSACSEASRSQVVYNPEAARGTECGVHGAMKTERRPRDQTNKT